MTSAPEAGSATDTAFLTVLTPAFRAASFLPANLASVAGTGAQHVVMDGGSDDGTVPLLEAASSVVWRSEPDRGQSHALNKALAHADGTWVGWLNADEFYLPGVLEWVQERLRADDVDVLYGDWAEVDLEGRLLRLVANHGYSAEVLRRGSCYVPSCATFIRRELLEQVGGWREDIRTIMDWDLWLRLDAAGARFRYEPVVMSGFTRHPGQVTARFTELTRVEQDRMRSEFGIDLPAWRHLAARGRRIGRKLLNHGYVRETAARFFSGAPLTGQPGDPDVRKAVCRLNPELAARSVARG
ncbi:glycosyltransferase family 2 protein [Petropleomorpha daqingensis]|uniref:Glycosyltransferase involved in cell wall biosynthesis n=1 Tax=Petropleomorpha daqingensis TaxID=2026353 RepID=A0A853CDE4_9ACTN|nr:glycosyltransferase involved in cell wall biosynthesis [Petropleomorpha daqingensis]